MTKTEHDDSAVQARSPASASLERPRLWAIITSRLIRPSSLTPGGRVAAWIAYACLAIGAVAWLTSTTAPFGRETLLDETEDGNRQVSRLVLIALFLVLIGVGWVSTYYAASARRHTRLVVAVVVTFGTCLGLWIFRGTEVLESVVSVAAEAFPPVDFGLQTINPGARAVLTVAIVASAALLIVPVRLLLRAPILTGLLAILPIIATFVVWAIAPHNDPALAAYFEQFSDQLTRDTLEASAASRALSFIVELAFTGLAGVLLFVALFEAREVGQAKSAVAPVLSRWRWSAPRRVIILLAGAKLVVLIVGFAGLLPGGNEPEQLWDVGTVSEWALAAAAVGTGALVLRWLGQGRLTTGAVHAHSLWLVVVLCLPGAFILLAGLTSLMVGWAQTGDALIDWSTDFALTLTRWSPLIAVIAAAIVVCSVGVRRKLTSDGFALLALFTIWAIVPAVHLAVTDDPDRWSIPPQYADAILSAGVLLLVLLGRVRTSILPLLIVILIVSSLVGFGDQLLPESIENRFFLLAFLLPVVWKFVYDTDGLRAANGVRLCLALLAWSVLLTVSAVALASTSQFPRGTWDFARRLEWRLLVPPLCVAWLWVYSCRPASSPQSAVAAMRPRRIGRSLPRGVAAGAACVLALLLASLGVGKLVQAATVDHVRRPEFRLQTTLGPDMDVQPGCAYKNQNGEGLTLALAESVAVLSERPYIFIIAEHNEPEVPLGDADTCIGAIVPILEPTFASGVCAIPSESSSAHVVIGGLPGLQADVIVDGLQYTVQCAYSADANAQRLVAAYFPTGLFQPDNVATISEVVAALQFVHASA